MIISRKLFHPPPPLPSPPPPGWTRSISSIIPGWPAVTQLLRQSPTMGERASVSTAHPPEKIAILIEFCLAGQVAGSDALVQISYKISIYSIPNTKWVNNIILLLQKNIFFIIVRLFLFLLRLLLMLLLLMLLPLLLLLNLHADAAANCSRQKIMVFLKHIPVEKYLKNSCFSKKYFWEQTKPNKQVFINRSWHVLDCSTSVSSVLYLPQILPYSRLFYFPVFCLVFTTDPTMF